MPTDNEEQKAELSDALNIIQQFMANEAKKNSAPPAKERRYTKPMLITMASISLITVFIYFFNVGGHWALIALCAIVCVIGFVGGTKIDALGMASVLFGFVLLITIPWMGFLKLDVTAYIMMGVLTLLSYYILHRNGGPITEFIIHATFWLFIISWIMNTDLTTLVMGVATKSDAQIKETMEAAMVFRCIFGSFTISHLGFRKETKLADLGS